MKSLSTYAELNARMRTRLGTLPDEGAMRALGRAEDLAEVAGMLKGGAYAPLVPLLEGRAPLADVEKELARIEIAEHRRLLRPARGPVRDLVFAFMEAYDVEKVEGLLRIWREKEWEGRRGVIEETICWEIPVDAVLRAAGIEEIILLLDRTPFRAPLAAAYPAFRADGRLYRLELSLERDYHRRLAAAIGRLGRADRAAAARMIGVEIDMRNIEILMRLRRHPGVTAAEAGEALLPGGLSLGEETLRAAFAAGDDRAIDALVGGLPLGEAAPAGGGDALDRLVLLGELLDGALAAEARRALTGFPFRIGPVVAYFIRRRAAARRLRGIIVGKALGLAAPAAAGG
ncbi:MAG: V-type ATPase subunit [bacterium]|nr:V-type ATPase subunit [bacterium]